LGRRAERVLAAGGSEAYLQAFECGVGFWEFGSSAGEDLLYILIRV
jgi:hypothetical protein